MFTFLKGFGVSGGLIVAIGAQNAFVIRQGLRRQHLLLTALLCALIDSILILLGVTGFGHFLSSFPLFFKWASWLSIIFLGVYGALSFKSALIEKKLNLSEQGDLSLKKTFFLLLALGLLNPHVYLDTVILLGSIASQQPTHEQLTFALGAMSASFAWFFSIVYGAKFLAPFFQKKNSWRILDCLIGCTMWGIALTLFKNII